MTLHHNETPYHNRLDNLDNTLKFSCKNRQVYMYISMESVSTELVLRIRVVLALVSLLLLFDSDPVLREPRSSHRNHDISKPCREYRLLVINLPLVE
jgi:hypothetical protein